VLIAPFALLLALADSPAPNDDATAASPAPVADVAVATAAAEPAAAQGGGKKASNDGLRFEWKEHPSIRAGKWLRLDFGTKIQADKMNPGDDPVAFDDFILKRARVGVDGELFKYFQFSLERELTSNGDLKVTAQSSKTQWRDVYGEIKFADALQIRGGRFKIPFSLDQLTGVSNNDFIYRSLGGDYLAPARDVGGMVHGRLFKRGLNYQAGIFEHDGDNSRSNKQAGGDRTTAVRVTGTPLRRVTKALNLDEAEFGANFATTDVKDSSFLPNGLRGRTVLSQFAFFEPVFVKGTRNRYGADLDWTRHQFGARAEYMLVSEQRTGQGLRGNTVPDAKAHAYYVQGTWIVTGDKKDRPVDPKKPLITGGGVGAIELAARYERIWFNSKATGEPAFSNSRAEVILPSGDTVLTLGVNWYVNRWVKLQLNGIHEDLQDPGRTPLLDGGTKFWSSVFRMQLAL
jgi:phosphate-selective porin OprO/OprP